MDVLSLSNDTFYSKLCVVIKICSKAITSIPEMLKQAHNISFSNVLNFKW